MVAHRGKRKENVGSNIYVNGAFTGPIRKHYLIRKYGKSLDIFYSRDRQSDLCRKHIILVALRKKNRVEEKQRQGD